MIHADCRMLLKLLCEMMVVCGKHATALGAFAKVREHRVCDRVPVECTVGRKEQKGRFENVSTQTHTHTHTHTQTTHLVPLPSSSKMTRLFDVAWLRMLAVSFNSTMNVERPAMMLSLAPMRVKMRSATVGEGVVNNFFVNKLSFVFKIKGKK